MTGRKSKPAGAVRVRTNVVLDPDAWHLVPGELFLAHRRNHEMTRLQREEAGYYRPCAICRRTGAEIGRSGCDRCPDVESLEDARTRWAARSEELDAVRLTVSEEFETGAGDDGRG